MAKVFFKKIKVEDQSMEGERRRFAVHHCLRMQPNPKKGMDGYQFI